MAWRSNSSPNPISTSPRRISCSSVFSLLNVHKTHSFFYAVVWLYNQLDCQGKGAIR